jgi:hypothetical protein
LLHEPQVWPTLGASAAARQEYWRRLVHEPLTERALTALRRSVTSDPLGAGDGATAWLSADAKAARSSAEATANGARRKRRNELTLRQDKLRKGGEDRSSLKPFIATL